MSATNSNINWTSASNITTRSESTRGDQGFADAGWCLASGGCFPYATTYALLGLFCANGFNLMRAVYNDVSVGHDWFRPLILSSLIYAEDNYRSKISLPSLLLDGDSAFHHISFAHLVARGERNPLFVSGKTGSDGHTRIKRRRPMLGDRLGLQSGYAASIFLDAGIAFAAVPVSFERLAFLRGMSWRDEARCRTAIRIYDCPRCKRRAAVSWSGSDRQGRPVFECECGKKVSKSVLEEASFWRRRED